MKKIISTVLCGIIIFAASTSIVMAQSYDKIIAFAALKNNSQFNGFLKESSVDSSSNNTISPVTKESLKLAEKNLNTSKADLKAMKANFRANENFKRLYKEVPDANWEVSQNGTVASFIKDDIRTNVYYDKKGYLNYILTYYPINKAPADVVSLVEDEYPNTDIDLVVDAKKADVEFYIIQLEDKRTIKQVTVCDGEINLIKEMQKSH